jgi:hypothetical protein
MNSFIIISALIGTTLIIVQGTVFKPFRRLWPSLLNCSQCTGMWVGIVAGGSGVVKIGNGRILDAFIVGAATSFLSLLVSAILLRLFGDPEESDSP